MVAPDEPAKYKTRKSWNNPSDSHSLTFSTFQRRKYLLDDQICGFLANRINQAARAHNFAVLAYVFMPDHVHLLIHPINEFYDMGDILKSIKQGPSRRAKNRKLIDTELWEPGGGHDSNIVIAGYLYRQNTIDYIHDNPVRKNMVEVGSQYRWSSADWYHHEGFSDIDCRYFFLLGEE